jgi:hypothetical protein
VPPGSLDNEDKVSHAQPMTVGFFVESILLATRQCDTHRQAGEKGLRVVECNERILRRGKLKIIEVKNQEGMDALPERFDSYTRIQIKASSEIQIVVKLARENSSVVAWGNSSVVARENSSVEARGNSSVVARENSSVEARGNSSVVAWENSSVVAWGNSSVEARENSSVEAWENSSVEARENSSVVARENSSVEAWENSSVVARGNSSVVAWGNSSVVARENSSVEARGNSSVVAWGNSSVVARENSSVEAWGNSSVVAWGNCVVRLLSAIKLTLKKFSVGISIGVKANLQFKAETATYVEVPASTYDKDEFLDIYSKNIQDDGRILLYKSTQGDDTDHFTGKIKYEGVVHPEKWDGDENRQCGDGLHLSPTASLAKSYNPGKIKRCLVRPEDFVVYPHDISKVRCKCVEVIED